MRDAVAIFSASHMNSATKKKSEQHVHAVAKAKHFVVHMTAPKQQSCGRKQSPAEIPDKMVREEIERKWRTPEAMLPTGADSWKNGNQRCG